MRRTPRLGLALAAVLGTRGRGAAATAADVPRRHQRGARRSLRHARQRHGRRPQGRPRSKCSRTASSRRSSRSSASSCGRPSRRSCAPSRTPCAESRQMAADPRARIFVIFLDTYHTGFGNAARMRAAAAAVHRSRRRPGRPGGADDAGDGRHRRDARPPHDGHLAAARRSPPGAAGSAWPTTIRSRTMYEACYAFEDPTIAPEMKRAAPREARRSTRSTISSTHLGGLRDERKAVLAVSEGWLQFGPNPALARLLKTRRGPRLPDPPGGIVGRGASARERRVRPACDRDKCKADRMALANLDDRIGCMRTSRARQSRQRHVLSGRRAGAGGLRLGHRPRAAADARSRTRPTCGTARTACGCSPT